jgi:hypothetical protein
MGTRVSQAAVAHPKSEYQGYTLPPPMLKTNDLLRDMHSSH